MLSPSPHPRESHGAVQAGTCSSLPQPPPALGLRGGVSGREEVLCLGSCCCVTARLLSGGAGRVVVRDRGQGFLTRVETTRAGSQQVLLSPRWRNPRPYFVPAFHRVLLLSRDFPLLSSTCVCARARARAYGVYVCTGQSQRPLGAFTYFRNACGFAPDLGIPSCPPKCSGDFHRVDYREGHFPLLSATPTLFYCSSPLDILSWKLSLRG